MVRRGTAGVVFRSLLFQALSFLVFVLLTLALITWITDAFSQTPADAGHPTLHQRYLDGVHLAQEGKQKEALAVFHDILAEEPKAKGSLYWSGYLNLQLGRPEKALSFINRLIALDSSSYQPLVLSIEANQALGREVEVDVARKKLQTLRDGGKVIPGLTDAKAYPRERFFQSHVEIDEFFDFTKDPFIVWEAIQRDADNHPTRDILLAYNPDTRAYLFGENVIENGAVKQFNLYRRLTAIPAYIDFRTWAMDRVNGTAPR